EPPPSFVGWALVGARALAAPLFSVYLSLAHALPVGPRDILYQVELASGKGVIRDAVTVANDHTASLARKMALYGARAVMTPQDRSRLDDMIGVMQEHPSRDERRSVHVTEAAPDVLEAPSRLPTGGGSPSALPAPRTRQGSNRRRPGIIRLTPVPASERI